MAQTKTSAKEKKREKGKSQPFRQKVLQLLHRRHRGGSLRLCVFLVSFLAGALPCLILRWSILYNYETRVVNSQTSQAQTQLRVLANHLLTYNYLEEATSAIVEAELTQFASFYDGRVLVIDDELTVIKDTYEMSTGKIVVSDDVVRCLTQGSDAVTTRYVKEDGYIEVIMPVSETRALEGGDYSGRGGGKETVYGVLLASVSTDTLAATMQIIERRANLIVLTMILIVFSVAVLASARISRPFEKVAQAFRDVASGYTSESISVNSYRETRAIVEAFNQVIGRMRALDESRQEFVSNVSHELKTPMTSMKVLADSLLQMGDNVPPEMYREFMQDISAELERENQTIEDLLRLAKMDRRQVTLNISSVDINDMVEMILHRLQPLARQKDVALVFISERCVRADVDEVKLSMVFTNLIENAIKYNVAHGQVTVTLDADQKHVIFICRDTGIGISREAQDRIFERFYRADPSRSQEISGTGLGLSIAKSIVLLHRGVIHVESEVNKGSVFTVMIPLTYVGGRTVEPSKELLRAQRQAQRQARRQERREEKRAHQQGHAAAGEPSVPEGPTPQRAEDGRARPPSNVRYGGAPSAGKEPAEGPTPQQERKD